MGINLNYPSQMAGATTVGLRGKNYVILASEKRFSYGGFVVSRSGKKVFKVTDYLGIALAGLFADMQAIVKILRAQIDYYNITVGRRISVSAAARLLATILYSNKYFPFLSETLVGGIEEDGTSRLYVMDPLGSLIEDNFAAIGSGGPIAVGVLEENYKEDLSLKDAEKLIVNSLKAAIRRDAASGDGIDVLIITKKEGSTVAEEKTFSL